MSLARVIAAVFDLFNRKRLSFRNVVGHKIRTLSGCRLPAANFTAAECSSLAQYWTDSKHRCPISHFEAKTCEIGSKKKKKTMLPCNGVHAGCQSVSSGSSSDQTGTYCTNTWMFIHEESWENRPQPHTHTACITYSELLPDSVFHFPSARTEVWAAQSLKLRPRLIWSASFHL